MEQINSREYWDDRFSSKNWDDNGGKEQTLFFAKVAYSLMPDFLKKDLLNNHWKVIDVGCAQGEGTSYFAEQFPTCQFVGQDFSEAAIKSAKETFSNCEFTVGDIYEEIPHADVVYSSNTLEHLNNPRVLMENMCNAAEKYVVHLLPFEDPLCIAEHINIFSHDAFPLRIGSFYLEYYKIFDCNELESNCWPAKQIMLVYTNQNYRPEYMTMLDVRHVFGIEKLEQQIAALEKDLKYSWEYMAEKVGALENKLTQASEQMNTLEIEFAEKKEHYWRKS